MSAEDTAVYERMEQEVVDLGKEIERLERQAAIDAELNRPTSEPIVNKPNNDPELEEGIEAVLLSSMGRVRSGLSRSGCMRFCMRWRFRADE